MPSRSISIIGVVTLLFVIAGVAYFLFFYHQKEALQGRASFELRFQGDYLPKILDSSTFTISSEGARVLLAVFGTESDKKEKQDVEADVVAKELESGEEKGVVIISVKKPDSLMLASKDEFICDLGIDTICEVALGRSYSSYTSSAEFFVNQGALIFSFDKNKIAGRIENGKTEDGATVEGSFEFEFSQDIAGASWAQDELAQAESRISFAETKDIQEVEKRNEQRIADMHLLGLGLFLYYQDNSTYPASEDASIIENSTLKEHPLYKALAGNEKYGIPKSAFPADPSGGELYYSYQSTEGGMSYILTAALEGVEDPTKDERCDLAITKAKCIYSVRP